MSFRSSRRDDSGEQVASRGRSGGTGRRGTAARREGPEAMKGTAHEMRGSAAVRPSPVFLAVVAATVLCGLIAWRYGTILERPGRIALFGFVIAAWILSLSLHE